MHFRIENAFYDDEGEKMPEQEKLSFLSRLSLLIATPAMKFALPMLILLAIVTGVLIKPAMEIQNDDDVIKFLPQDDPKVVKFMEIGDQFHGLQMAIVGIEAEEGKDLFNVNDLMLIRLASREFKLLECHDKETGEKTFCVSNTTSFSEIKDIAHSTRESGEEEAAVTDLVPDLPMPDAYAQMSADEKKAIDDMLQDVKTRTLSLDHVCGFLVSPDARAAAIYAQVDDTRVSTKEASDLIRDKIEEIQARLGTNTNLYYGGSPFIGGYSADQARSDMTALSPIVIAIVVLIILITSKSIFATLIALVSVGISMVWVLGGMSLVGLKMTLVATSLPILLVALGSAYAIHLISAMLSQLDRGKSRRESMRKALILTGPPIIVCVLTTAAGFFSFLTMDVTPMTEYGAAMGIATLIIMFVTFWFVTAACILLPIKPQKEGRAPKWAMNIMKNSANAVYKHGKLVAVIVAAIAIICACFTTRVEPHGDNSSLFAPGSLPVVADDFMNNNFGGSNFIQTEVKGNINNPLVLRQIERMTAFINAHPRIAGMQSISDVIVLVGGTMGDGQHIPASPTLTATLSSLAFADDASVAMMAEMSWKASLLQIRVKGKDISEGARISDEIYDSIHDLYQPRIAVPREKLDDQAAQIERDEIVQHIQWIFQKYGKELDKNAIENAVFNAQTKLAREDIRIVANINLFDENDAIIYMDEEKTTLDDLSSKIAEAFETATYSQDYLAKLLESVAESGETDNRDAFDKSVEFIHIAFQDAQREKIRKLRTKALFDLANIDNPSEKFNQLVESAVWCLGDNVAFLPRDKVSENVKTAAVDTQIFEVIPSGYPVIYRAMNASVIHNQIWSLAASFAMVFLCLVLFTRSLLVGAVSLIPASLTVLITFGFMGAFNIGMDVGSSMIAAISLSVGIDYACHLIWKFGRPGSDPEDQQRASDHMLETTGWGIVINALEVGLGLSVLYFGELLPMRNFGILTGLAMIVSAIASLLLISGLLRFATKKLPKTANPDNDDFSNETPTPTPSEQTKDAVSDDESHKEIVPSDNAAEA